MEETAPEKAPSKVAQHLRRFHHGSKSCSDLATTSPYSYSFAPRRPADPVELCPPHWPLLEKQPLKTRLGAILVKDWQRLRLQPQEHRQRTSERPTMMRMKDSDDYITARAANPRTGMISPSVGSPSPYAPLTPESPAEALKLRKETVAPISPTPEVENRPTLRRANERRKVSAGGTWRAKGNRWIIDGTTNVASPRVAATEAVSTKAQPLLDADQFVVKMPSAREPQPYAFPGYSAKQIEAFEHYKEKARKVSSEGYDQRILQAARQPSGGGIRASDKDGNPSEHVGSYAMRAFAKENVAVPNRDITVLKRRAKIHDQCKGEPETACTGGAESRAANFAAFSSPKTPAMRFGKTTATSLTTFARSLHGAQKLHVHNPIARKPVGKSAGTAGLQGLPPVNLAHPSVAAVPPKQRVPLFEEATATPKHNAETLESQASLHALNWLSDLLIGALVSIFELSKHVRLPQVSVPVLEVLRSEHAPAQQKVEAMKTVLFSTGQALGFVTAVVMVWNLGSVVIRILEVFFWPLTVPLRVQRWVAGG